MKRSFFLLLCMMSMLMSYAADVLLDFRTNNFEGWVYTQSGVEINNYTISQDNINLYGEYALISPEVTAPNVKSITVNVSGHTKFYALEEYSNPRVSVQLLSESDELLNEVKYSFSTKERDRNFEVDFDVTDFGETPFKLRLACWNANEYSCLSVRKVKVTVKEYNLSGVIGDVNNDGVVTSADITSLYDYLLNNDDTNIVNGDVSGDGLITSADITSVYSVMLGTI